MTAPGCSKLHIDIETYSSVDIGKAGLHKYVQAPDFQILLFAYSLNDQPVEIVDLARGEQIPTEILDALSDPSCLKYAYNAAFEWTCLSKWFWQAYPIDQWRCSMLHGCYCGFPAGLGLIGTALGFEEDKKKLATGKALIKLFCTKHARGQQGTIWDTERIQPDMEPEKWELFKEYCKQDVVTEMEVERRLEEWPVPATVQREWELDVLTNAVGVKIDTDLVEGALACHAEITAELTEKAKEITGLANPNSPTQMKNWLEGQLGHEVPNLTKATVADLIAEIPEDAPAKKALAIRQELAKTSVKKYDAMRAAVCEDGRVRGLLQFYGARTGRWAGRLVQVQNLPRNYLDSLDAARQLVKTRKTDALKLIYGNVPDTLSQLIRTAFIPSTENHVMVVADFSAIEARVISWLAGEEWRLEAFRQGKDIYCESASQMFGVPVEKHGQNSHLRQKGKIAELALGYQGGVGALKAMGADKMGLSDEELQEIVTRWRKANPKIVEFWGSVEESAYTALTFPPCRPQLEEPYTQICGQPAIKFCHRKDKYNLSMLTIEIPSGRKLFYPNPCVGTNKKGFAAIHYDGLNTANKWARLETYGGKLTENIVQAVARDCLSVTLNRMNLNGYHTVMHIHDEVVLDVLEENADLNAAVRLMCEPISWAPGLPLNADGFISTYYKKD